MKRFFVILVLTLIGLNSLGQTIELKKAIDLNITENFARVDKSSLASSQSSKSKFSLFRHQNLQGEAFKLDNSTVLLSVGTGHLKSDHLENLQKGNKEMISRANPKLFKSEIRTVNNYRALIMQYEFGLDSLGSYNIYCLNNKNDKVLFGVLEYDISNRIAAQHSIEKLLKGIYFK